MARKKRSISISITEADRDKAIASNSGGCLIADALKRQGFARPVVDMATIAVTDRDAGERRWYLTPPTGQEVLLWLDQGWPQRGDKTITLQRPVKVTPITRQATGAKSPENYAAERAVKVAALEAKPELTKQEKAALTRMKRAKPAPKRPRARGPARVDSKGTVHGGQPLSREPHPNLLRSTDRHFGAKMADPGVAFTEAVAEAVALDRAARETTT